MTPEERAELLAAYALGALPEPAANAVRDLVRTDDAAAAELAGYHELVDLVALSVPLRRADPALRSRLLSAARREGSPLRRRRPPRAYLPWVAAAAMLIPMALIAIGLHRDLDTLRDRNAELAAVVEADAKRLDQLLTMDAGDASSRVLRLQLQSATAGLQLALAVSTAPDARSFVLESTAAGHGAQGRLLWSQSTNAGWVTVRDLPALPLGRVYQLWLIDGDRQVPAGEFTPDDLNRAEAVVAPAQAIVPRRLEIAVAPEGGSAAVGSPVVLTASLVLVVP